MSFLSTVTDQFSYFARQTGDWEWQGKNVLDFGGNVGNMLRDPNSTIDSDRYWCLDVDRKALERGKKSYPKSHWLFYDRYCFFFNPRGVRNLRVPDLGQSFDYIVAYSVFTNTPQSEMIQLVDELTNLLSKRGTLAFTFIDPFYCSWQGDYKINNFRWRLELESDRGHLSRRQIPKLVDKAKGASWFTLINGADLYIETDDIPAYRPKAQRTFHVFHSSRHMERLFPAAAVLEPVNQAMQHCCVIRKSMGR